MKDNQKTQIPSNIYELHESLAYKTLKATLKLIKDPRKPVTHNQAHKASIRGSLAANNYMIKQLIHIILP